MFVHVYFAVINYEVTVVTGDVTFAGTNAKVFIQIYGDNGKTEVITLQSRSNNFERDTTEIFKVSQLGLYVFNAKVHLTCYRKAHFQIFFITFVKMLLRSREKMWGRFSRSASGTMAQGLDLAGSWSLWMSNI